MKVHMPLKGVAIAGKSGSGKSSIFFGSKHVLGVIIADTGSMGHLAYAQRGAESVILDPGSKDSPIDQTLRLARAWSAAGKIWVLDSFSALQEQQVAWFKANRAKSRGTMNVKDHMLVVGDLRDAALVLASLPGFAIFNTAPGGMVKTPDGPPVEYPKGALVGYPSLSGIGANSESILSRWTTSWVIFPGYIWRDREGNATRQVPRGFLLPQRDLRGNEAGQYTPIKDPLGVLEETKEGDRGQEVHAFLPWGACTIDDMLERIAKRFPPPQEKK